MLNFLYSGKYEEMKALCIEYRDRYLSASQHDRIDKTLNETREEAEESRKPQKLLIETNGSDDEQELLGNNNEENEKTILVNEEEYKITMEEEPLLLDRYGK